MWVTRLRIRHDCIIGNRCRKFSVTTTGMPFSVYIKDGVTYSPQIHRLDGNPGNVSAFIEDLKGDAHVENLEVEESIIFLVEVRRGDRVTASVFSALAPRIIFVKPVVVDTEGYEYWEVASWKKSILSDFIAGILQEVSSDVKVLKMEKTNLKDVYFPSLMPSLSSHQKTAFLTALRNGYYSWPKRSTLGQLAKIMGVSVSTFREHLKRAEEKLMPDIAKLL